MKYRLIICLLLSAGMVMAQTKVKIEPVDAILEIDGREYITEDGEVDVYLPDGQHNIVVMMQGHDTYENTVTFGKDNREISIKLKERSGFLIVSESAQSLGSSVYLDNKLVGTVPIRNMKLLCGPHSVVVTKKGYDSYSERVFITTGKTSEVIPILDIKKCHVHMVAAAGVEIWFDGVKQGVEEWTGNMDEGTYTIVTKKESHQNGISQIVLTEADSVQEVMLPLPQPLYGSLMVDVMPMGSKITIDGKVEGVTPLFKQMMLIGNHTIKVESAGLLPMTKEITITENETMDIKGTLVEGNEVKLTCDADDAEWEVDGVAIGKGANVAVVLPFGVHSVNILTEDFEQYTGSFTISKSVTNVEIRLKPKAPEYLGVDINGYILRFVKIKANGTTITEDFYISETEVTQQLWQLVMERSIYDQRNNAGKTSSYGEGDSYPIYFVSWNECIRFLRKLSKTSGFTFTLPSEAQWMYVAEGGIYKKQEKEMDYLYWHKANSGGKSHDVYKSGMNVLGVYGMFGNVAEMCMDQLSMSMYKYHVCKGGSWNNTISECDVLSRSSIELNKREKDVGFRIVIKTQSTESDE